MIRKIAKYKVRREALAAVEAAIHEFVTAISQAEPDTTYTAFRTGDETTFIHFMEFPDSKAETHHQKAPYTLKFVEVLYPKCEIQPEFTDLIPMSTSKQDEIV